MAEAQLPATGAAASTAAAAGQVALPRTAADVTAPATGVVMHPAYAKAVGRLAYVWGWPMVNMLNRSAAITQAPKPGRLNGVLPVAPRGQVGMLADYIDPGQTFVTCPNQDVVYGLGFFSLDEEPVVAQVPDFGDRFWVYALYDARTDQFAELGKPYKTKPGFYLLVGPNWKGDKPAGIEAVIRSSTALANAIPRVFMDDTPEDRKAIQSAINQIVFYPLKDFDGKMKTQDWAQAPAIPGPKSEGGGETKWVVPEKFFDQLGTVLDTVAPLPGEEALYGQFRVLLDAAAKDPAIKKALVEAAVETEREVIEPFFAWKRNGRPAGNGWNRSTNNARFGHDYYNRTGTAKSNMFDNKPTETQYFYTDDDSAGARLDGTHSYEVTLRARPGAAGQRLLVDDPLQQRALLPPERPEALLARHQEQAPPEGRRRLADAVRRGAVAGCRQGVELAARADRPLLALHPRLLGPAGHSRRLVAAADHSASQVRARRRVETSQRATIASAQLVTADGAGAPLHRSVGRAATVGAQAWR